MTLFGRKLSPTCAKHQLKDDADGHFWEFIQQVVTWLLVVMGWLVLSDQAERREVTKSYFGRLQDLRKNSDLLRSSVGAFMRMRTAK